MEMINALQRKNNELEQQLMALSTEVQKHKEEEQRWQQERAVGYELMAKQTTLDTAQYKCMFNIQNENIQKQDIILELTNEVEQSHFTVSTLQATADRLASENKRLWKEIMALRDRKDERILQQIQSLDPSLSYSNGVLFSAVPLNENVQWEFSFCFVFSIYAELVRLKNLIELGKKTLTAQTEEIEKLSIENKSLNEQIHNLTGILKEKGLFKTYRPGTMTDWKEKDLQELQAEMVKERTQMQREDLKRIFERQEQIYWQQPQDNDNDNNNNNNNENDNAGDSKSIPSTTNTQPSGSAIPSGHNQTRTMSWNESDFQTAKNEMMAQLKQLKDQQIAEMLEKQDALRMQKTDDTAKHLHVKLPNCVF
ncbi:C2H2-type zinc finger-containing protein [Reticulomyxa filosa]|uniref:C2H2-type zinc finger-containing protein n=1 Tax=Reticulomyxa filosa TaxID=46433 RepID=X6NV82_RETFI|nr:C2H2-type zinc finger-containing protein [Reticulomyxa filosa]|eukprot:ETO29896.1 C2H2-type zinc finger-containing protein [Reticulomyxa filosa]